MPRYAYAGPEPRPDDGNCIVRPGEIREFSELPPWGPWAEVAEDGSWSQSTGVQFELDAPRDPPAGPPASDPPAGDPPPPPRRRTSPPAPADTPAKGEGENQ